MRFASLLVSDDPAMTPIDIRAISDWIAGIGVSTCQSDDQECGIESYAMSGMKIHRKY